MDFDDGDSANLPFIKAVHYNKEIGSYVFNHKDVGKLLLNDKYKDKNVMIISVAGAFRKGKSFLLNFMIRYLKYAQLNGYTDSIDWMGQPDEPLHGFPWRGGSERETDGILLWGEPFIVELPSKEELVILLMDTQGAFDSNSTVKDCAIVFAISTMISSVQIYNISGNLQEDYLSHLQLFTEYGRIALEASQTKPFQDLLFLIRDWSYPYEFQYGYSKEFLEKKLKVSDAQPAELQCVRQHIHDCFENVNLFLLPHPGIKVAITPNFVGSLNDIDEPFRLELSKLVTSVLNLDKLKPKVVGGAPIRCCDLMTFFESYINIFQSDVLPEPKNMLLATAEANNLVALNASKQYYVDSMNEICGGDKPFIPSDILSSKHTQYYDEAVQRFVQVKKFGNDSIMNQYREKLTMELKDCFQDYSKMNSNKQVNSIKIIITAFIICLLSFLTSELLDLVGLDFLMLPFNLISIFCLTLVLFTSYAQFYGGFAEILYYLNMIPEALIDNIQQLLLKGYLETKKKS